jgi:O-antigen ligase
VEVDKIGPMYFVCIALLVRADTWLEGASLDDTLLKEE